MIFSLVKFISFCTFFFSISCHFSLIQSVPFQFSVLLSRPPLSGIILSFKLFFFFFCERFLTPLCLANKIPSQSHILLEDPVTAVLRAVAVHLHTFAFSITQSLEIKAGSYSFLALAQRMFLATLPMSDFLKFANLISVT